MFQKVLIANRGEIAVRIIRTLDDLGIDSVAVHSEPDRSAPHVRAATEAWPVGPGPVAESYLDQDRLLEVIAASGAEAVHPGYGLLSENESFAQRCEEAGCRWLGPTPEQIRCFGLKHTARELAANASVPLVPGTGLLESLEEAVSTATEIGYPVMLKSTAGGGGIGMAVCRDEAGLREAYGRVQRLGEKNFGQAGVFLERFVGRARHIEVQIFGDGEGQVVALGERDCSAQRRNQKVIEESPAPQLPPEVRSQLLAAAIRLGQSVRYRSAGTVEFLYDDEREEFYFLEVNTRLQVEHGVTELCTGVDLVAWMVRLGGGERDFLTGDHPPSGHAIEVRLYAENPSRDFLPSVGTLHKVSFPPSARCDTWIESGTEVSAYYDPLLAKLLVHGPDRETATQAMAEALGDTTLAGLATNLPYLRATVESETFRRGEVTTTWLAGFHYDDRSIEVQRGGTQTTVQDWPGRKGYWDVGVPPSGPMDDRSFRLANLLTGNPEGTAGLEITLDGPTLRFGSDTVVALTGAPVEASLDDDPFPMWESVNIPAGAVLRIGRTQGPGFRCYLAVRGGIDVPDYLGSKSTFTLGRFGGHAGRALQPGDVLPVGPSPAGGPALRVRPDRRPQFSSNWEISVLYGPHGAPDFFTEEDIGTLFATEWEIHFNSARTGVRLIGPKPAWAREDGGEAGLHPSNIHDNAYAVGTVDFTGNMPVILGPDGPSLGGFVCPATIIEADLWKIGQLRPGDRVRFVPTTHGEARAHLRGANAALGRLEFAGTVPPASTISSGEISPIVAEWGEGEEAFVVRQAGDRYLLVEIGPPRLDLRLRFHVHLLHQHLLERDLPGVIELTPGIRSLQVHYDPDLLPTGELLAALQDTDRELGALHEAVPARIVHLPLSWDDPSTRLAIEKYTTSVNPTAPWCPSNIEFIRRINGLESIEDVKQIVFEASYLVLGLGDVYLGAPVATPLDPRHRLVTTKYNPARTWTPENAVGIGGAYLCIYGMEGPGGYQFVGRTVQMWNRFRQTPVFTADRPWLLRFFDQVRFYEVDPGELPELRRRMETGEWTPRIEETTFDPRSYDAFLDANGPSIEAFRQQQRRAFREERDRWKLAGLDLDDPEEEHLEETKEIEIPPGCEALESPMGGAVWKVEREEGDRLDERDVVIVLEAMKTEIAVETLAAGVVRKLLVKAGDTVTSGEVLAIIETNA